MKSLTVFCGARPGKNEKYLELAKALGDQLAQRKITLIYGGASCGLMGAVADSALAAGGEVVGVIPKSIIELEVAHESLPNLHVVENMHKRKEMLYDLGDAAVLIPGGSGSMDEFFEFLVWKKIGIHKKPLILVNAHGYFDPLLNLLDHMAKEEFMDTKDMDHIRVVKSIDQIW